MLDLIIRGGQVVTPEAVGEADLGIKGEKIVAIAAPNTLSTEGARVIDAPGKIVVPGGIEPHAHIAHPIYTLRGESLTTAGPADDTRAAAFGGVTTVVDFSYQEPDVGIMQSFEKKDALFRGQSYIDYSFHCILKGQLPTSIINEIPQAISSGFPTMKIFTTHVRVEGLHSNKLEFGYVWPIFEQLQKHGGVAMVHAEDDDIVQYMYRRLQEEGQMEAWNIHLVHNNLSEDLSFRRVTRLAQQTGTAVYFVHVSAKEGVNAIAEARSQGQPVYGETLHNYASFTSDDYRKGPRGLALHTYPSLKSREDRETLWRGLLDGGALSTTATDEYATSLEIKLKGQTIMDITGGHNGVETRMSIIYTEGVVKQGMSLQRYADVTSTNAARILGFYPRKGAIVPGSDADIAIIDPSIHKKLTMNDLHISDYSIWEGWEARGWPVTTILRGQVIVDGGKLLGQPGDGQLIPRKVGSEVLSKPVC